MESLIKQYTDDTIKCIQHGVMTYIYHVTGRFVLKHWNDEPWTQNEARFPKTTEPRFGMKM